ncbi:MAG: hypothetical protein GTO24_04065 [candidate division Zixibacteria bacterium]|nr:hypothetical protein [candidate division Zixibacteria bacterium]
MKTISSASYLLSSKLRVKNILMLILSFTLLLIFSPVVQAQDLLANWDFTDNVGETYNILSSISDPEFSATLGTNNPLWTCCFWNRVEGDAVYRIRNAGVVNYDPAVPYQGYIYIKVESNRPWRLDEIRAIISENANPAGNDIPVDVNVEYSTEADFDPYMVLGTETVNGSKSCVFNGPISFPPGIRYIRFRSTSDMWCSPYLGVDNVQILGLHPFLEVAIDIKPGSDPNSINLSSAGVIPVAILSSDTFDATTVNPDTVSLAGARVKLVGKSGKYLCHEEDVNGDELLDLVCQVYTAESMIEEGESVAVLEAETFDGVQIRGEDTIRIVQDQ